MVVKKKLIAVSKIGEEEDITAVLQVAVQKMEYDDLCTDENM